MPDLPAVTFGMIEFPATFRRDKVKFHPLSTGTDGDGAPLINEPGAGTPVEIACQVSDSKTTDLVREYGDPIAPSGVIIYDIMFGKEGLDALVTGGLYDPANDKWIAAKQMGEWTGNRDGTFTSPIPMRFRGPINVRHGIGSRYTATAARVA